MGRREQRRDWRGDDLFLFSDDGLSVRLGERRVKQERETVGNRDREREGKKDSERGKMRKREMEFGLVSARLDSATERLRW